MRRVGARGPVLNLYDAHHDFAWVLVLANGAAGAWALAANWLTSLRGKALWIFVALAELTIVVQVVLGVVVVDRYDLDVPQFHAFYGFVSLIAVAIIYSYRIQMRHRLYLLYGFGSLFVMGLGIRAMMLGPTR